MIVLYSDSLEACGDDTAARDVIIAQELGHISAGHVRSHWFLMPAAAYQLRGEDVVSYSNLEDDFERLPNEIRRGSRRTRQSPQDSRL
jgi:hypothetical protein